VPFNSPIPDGGQRGKRKSLVSAIIQAEKMVQIALILPCSAFIGWLAGAWIGSKVHQAWPGALGVVFGGAAGLFYVIRMAMDAVKGPADGSPAKSSEKGNDGGN
jgi:ATP synthase protein I